MELFKTDGRGSERNSATRAFVLAKDFNLPQSASSAWLPESKLVNLGTFDLKDFTGAFYISGNDFAETTDLCASTILLKGQTIKRHISILVLDSRKQVRK